MNFARVLFRSFHQTTRSSVQDAKKNKTARETLKLINSSPWQRTEVNKITQTMPNWKKQVLALKQKFKGERWNPTKKLSRGEMESLRLLRSQFPNLTATDLSKRYKVSPEVIRRILKSKWQPTEKEMIRINARWQRRGTRVQELYDANPDIPSNPKNNIMAKKIRISSDRDSAGFVLRKSNVNVAKNSKSKLGSENQKKKSKLFLLQNSRRES